jgi:hypothetical protein
MKKEEKNSHILPFKAWVVYFSPYCCATPQGIQEKNGKFWVIFDSLMQTIAGEVILNQKTSTDGEAIINFGQAKTNLFINIYNWQVSYPNEIIYLALANITACFHFPWISADISGAFRYLTEQFCFISMSHVLGSNTSASSWEPLQWAIQKMITVLWTNSNLVQKHKELLDILKWQDWTPTEVNLVHAYACDINPGIHKVGAKSLLSAHIYVDNILAAAACRETMLRLLAAIIKAIFLICGVPDIAVCQCPLLLEKWSELIVGLRQVILGLIVDTNKMTVGITDEYIQQVQDLLSL